MIVAEIASGKTVDVKLLRNGKEIAMKVTVEEMSENKIASQMGSPQQTLGITVDDINPKWQRMFHLKDKTGVVVIDILPASPADNAGIQAGDIIKEINRKPIRNITEFTTLLSQMEKDKPVLFLIKRGAQTFYVSIGGPQ